MIQSISPNTNIQNPNFKGYRTGKKIADDLHFFKQHYRNDPVFHLVKSDMIERNPFSIKCYNTVNTMRNMKTNFINKIKRHK